MNGTWGRSGVGGGSGGGDGQRNQECFKFRIKIDEDLCLEFKFIEGSLFVHGSVGLNNIGDITGYHVVQC